MTTYIQRYRDRTRMNHWLVALLFVTAGLSGLAFFHPSLFFFSALFGGGTWTRILHPFLGVGMVLGFALLFLQVWRENIWNRTDTEWVKHTPDLMVGNKDAMPKVGKYNAGQKGVFWLFAICLPVLLLTGIAFWQPWFAGFFPILVRRIAVVLHAAAAFGLVLGVIVHVYAAIWVQGSMRAMTRGTVSTAWARQNHPLWHREMTERR